MRNGGSRDQFPPPPETGGQPINTLIVEKDTGATAISMGHPYALRRGHPDYYPMMIAASALGEHRQFHGRLFQELRAKRGLNYGDYAYIESFEQEGWSRLGVTNAPRRQQHFSIWIRPVESANRLFALHAALYELDRLVRSGLTEQEVEGTKNFLAGYTMLWSATDSRRLGYALDDNFYGNAAPGHLDGLRAALASIRRAEVNDAIRRWLDPSKLRIAIVTADAASLREQLAAGAPAPIAYPTPKPPEVLEADKAIAAYPLKIASDKIAIVPVGKLFETAKLPAQ
jgi:zinc protease